MISSSTPFVFSFLIAIGLDSVSKVVDSSVRSGVTFALLETSIQSREMLEQHGRCYCCSFFQLQINNDHPVLVVVILFSN